MRDIELDDEPGPNLEGKAETLKSKPQVDQNLIVQTIEEPKVIQELNLRTEEPLQSLNSAKPHDD